MGRAGLSDSELSELLRQTSRTFALAIPLLPEPLARDVGAAYLLFRIADTFEDATRWDRAKRIQALTAFIEWLDSESAGGPTNFIDDAKKDPPVSDDACIDLIAKAEHVLATLSGPSLGEASPLRAITVKEHVLRTATAMRGFVEKQDERGGLVLTSEEDLVAYCYAVAGIVGEMLTQLFEIANPQLARLTYERIATPDGFKEQAVAFGEGLQLVNILKDATDDERAGRIYIPKTLERSAVVARARNDLAIAERYVATLRSANVAAGIIAFCELPRRLAVATLDALERGEPKLSRDQVASIVAEVTSG